MKILYWYNFERKTEKTIQATSMTRTDKTVCYSFITFLEELFQLYKE